MIPPARGLVVAGERESCVLRAGQPPACHAYPPVLVARTPSALLGVASSQEALLLHEDASAHRAAACGRQEPAEPGLDRPGQQRSHRTEASPRHPRPSVAETALVRRSRPSPGESVTAPVAMCSRAHKSGR